MFVFQSDVTFSSIEIGRGTANFESDTFDPSMNLLVDLRNADTRARGPVVRSKIDAFFQDAAMIFSTGTKVAVIAGEALSFGLTRMYQPVVDAMPWDFATFREMEAALEWIGLPSDFIDPS